MIRARQDTCILTIPPPQVGIVQALRQSVSCPELGRMSAHLPAWSGPMQGAELQQAIAVGEGRWDCWQLCVRLHKLVELDVPVVLLVGRQMEAFHGREEGGVRGIYRWDSGSRIIYEARARIKGQVMEIPPLRQKRNKHVNAITDTFPVLGLIRSIAKLEALSYIGIHGLICVSAKALDALTVMWISGRPWPHHSEAVLRRVRVI